MVVSKNVLIEARKVLFVKVINGLIMHYYKLGKVGSFV